MTKAITGIESDLNNYVAPEGELLYTVDSQKLKVGNGRDAGGILISPEVGTWTPNINLQTGTDYTTATITLYEAQYTKVKDRVNFNLYFTLGDLISGRYLYANFNLPKTITANDNIIAVTNVYEMSSSIAIPGICMMFFNTPTIFVGSSGVRIPNGVTSCNVNIVGSYMTNEA